MCTHTYVLHIDQVAITNPLNSLCSRVPRVRALPSTRGRGSSKGWKEPGLATHSPLDFLSPSLAKPHFWKAGFTFYESGQCKKKLISHRVVNRWVLPGEWSLKQEAWPPPVCVFCLRSAGPETLSRSPVLPCCPQDKPRQCAGQGGVCPAAGCFRLPHNLDVLLVIWSSSEQSCDKLETQGHSCEH